MKIYQPLLNWMHERQSIYLKKQRCEPKPWTKDEIMLRYKFTNVFRDQDKVSRDLIEILEQNNHRPAQQILFNTLVYRFFNHPATYRALAGKAGWITRWDPKKMKAALQYRKDHGYQNFTGAYIITNQGRTTPKHIMAVDTLTMMYKDKALLLAKILKNNRVQDTVELFKHYDMVGGFIAYEFACDLTYTPLLRNAEDLLTWAHAGPGAKRGLNRLYGNPVKKSMTEKVALDLMRTVFLYVDSHHKLDRPIQMRDIEHSLCEFDKYERVRLGEGRPRGKYQGEAE